MKLVVDQRALSIRQPWAHFVVNGPKPVENRGQPCPEKFIGQTIYIHTGKKFDGVGLKWLKEHAHELGIVDELAKMEAIGWPRGGLVGQVKITQCVTAWAGAWFAGPYGFVMEDAKAFKKIVPCNGQLGFFNPRIKI